MAGTPSLDGTAGKPRPSSCLLRASISGPQVASLKGRQRGPLLHLHFERKLGKVLQKVQRGKCGANNSWRLRACVQLRGPEVIWHLEQAQGCSPEAPGAAGAADRAASPPPAIVIFQSRNFPKLSTWTSCVT